MPLKYLSNYLKIAQKAIDKLQNRIKNLNGQLSAAGADNTNANPNDIILSIKDTKYMFL